MDRAPHFRLVIMIVQRVGRVGAQRARVGVESLETVGSPDNRCHCSTVEGLCQSIPCTIRPLRIRSGPHQMPACIVSPEGESLAQGALTHSQQGRRRLKLGLPFLGRKKVSQKSLFVIWLTCLDEIIIINYC